MSEAAEPETRQIFYGEGGPYYVVREGVRFRIIRAVDRKVMVIFPKEAFAFETFAWVDLFMMKRDPWSVPKEIRVNPQRKHSGEPPF